MKIKAFSKTLMAVGISSGLLWASNVFADTPPIYISKVSAIAQDINREAPELQPKVLRYALWAYGCARQDNVTKKPYLTIIDFSKPSHEKRLWVVDVQNGKVLFDTWVAHGQGSGGDIPYRFSDTPQTHESSLGLYLTLNSYYGHDGYSMRLKGIKR